MHFSKIPIVKNVWDPAATGKFRLFVVTISQW